MDHITFIEHLSKQAGAMALDSFRQPASSDIEFKNDRDLVTIVDKQVEDFIVSEIKSTYPTHSIFGEETGRSEGSTDYCWIIDPIDGTTSFVHGQPFFSTSIALYKGDKPIVGAVHAPALNDIFLAETGGGATLNGERIRVSERSTLLTSVLSTGFACLRAEQKDNNLKYFARIAPKLRGVRRFGSCAIDLAYVACGRLEGFWELCLEPYDIAAGALIVKEAGGCVSDFAGGTNYPAAGIVASNSHIHAALLHELEP